MLSSVTASALNSSFLVPLLPNSPVAAAGATPAETASSGSDLLCLSSPGSLAENDLYQQQVSWKLRANTQLQVTEDGQSLATAQAKLRFRYDFEAADGSTIQIRLQANLKYAQLTDGDAESQTTKLRASMHVSVLQQNVASGVAPLLDDPNTSPDAQDAMAQALELFQQVTETATSLFQASSPMDGDSLVTGLVDAFNELSESITSALLPASEEPALAGEVIDVPPPVTVEPTEVAPSTPDVPAADLPVMVDVPLAETTSETTSTSTEPASIEPEAAENAATEEPPVQAEEATPDAEPATDTSSEPTTTPVSTVAPQLLATTVMLRVRLQMV